jgi:hypothetical protein
MSSPATSFTTFALPRAHQPRQNPVEVGQRQFRQGHQHPHALASDETYDGETYLIGFTTSAAEGFHFRRKRFVNTAAEAIDFSQPRTFPGQVFYSKPTVDTATFTLVAPTTNQHRAYGYDCANVTVIGRTSSGGPAGTITFTPPASHTINGGAASAAVVFSGFDCPPTFAIYYDGNGAWTISRLTHA